MKNPQLEKIENMKNNDMTFNHFAHNYCDGLYDPNFKYEEQCSGYKQLRLMLERGITPATKEEIERWEKYPTQEELFSIPETKYMRNLHPLLRIFVQENWDKIKNLKL